MQISTRSFFDRTSSYLGDLSAQNDKLQAEISTGKRIQAPSDDSLAYQRLEGLKRDKADDTAWKTNITLAQTILAESDTALGSVVNQLQRAQELAIRGRSGTYSATDRQAIAAEVKSLSDSIVSLINAKDVRGQPLFGAASGNTGVTVDANGNVSFDGTGQPAAIPIGEGDSVQTNDSAEKILGNLTTASGATDVFGVLKQLTTALNANDSAGIGAAVDDLNAALDQVNGARGSVGARAARLDLEASRIDQAQSTREIDRSSLEDTDTQAAIIELQKVSTILQATQASFTKLTSLSLFDYIR